MAAATYWDQIPPAASWADQHHYLTGPALAGAISADQLPWDPSVQALLPFPNILDMMASDPSWTHEMGDAFLSQQPQVMDAVQRQRQVAYRYGYLRSNPQILVTTGPYIAIAPVNPGFIVVPFYNPAIVFFPPRPGFVVGGAIGFNFGISLGVAFQPWGWGYNRFDWGSHAIFVNNAPWGRTWANRAVYVHPYAANLRYARTGNQTGSRGGGRPAVAPAARRNALTAAAHRIGAQGCANRSQSRGRTQIRGAPLISCVPQSRKTGTAREFRRSCDNSGLYPFCPAREFRCPAFLCLILISAADEYRVPVRRQGFSRALPVLGGVVNHARYAAIRKTGTAREFSPLLRQIRACTLFAPPPNLVARRSFVLPQFRLRINIACQFVVKDFRGGWHRDAPAYNFAIGPRTSVEFGGLRFVRLYHCAVQRHARKCAACP